MRRAVLFTAAMVFGCGSDADLAGVATGGAGGSAGLGDAGWSDAGGAAGFAGGLGGTAGGGGVPANGFTRYPHNAPRSPITASVVSSMAAIASQVPRTDNVFMKVGASGTVSPLLLHCFAGPTKPEYQLEWGKYADLAPTIEFFRAGKAAGATPFDRETLAAQVGKSAVWAITGSPSPLEQELSALDPRWAFVNYGTNDMGLGVTYASALFSFAKSLDQLLQQLEQSGVVPIVTGLNPRSDSVAAARWVPTYDVVTRAMAEARQLPYLSLYLLNHPLPDQGLVADGIHGNSYLNGGPQPCNFSTSALQFNYNLRNLQSARILDHLKAAMVDGAAASDDPGVAYSGSGTASDPFIIDRLPFSHSRDSGAGQRIIASYPSCQASQDESGPETYYRLELSVPASLRAVVIDGPDADIDLHLLDAGSSCLSRHDRLIETTLQPGTYTFVLDTFVADGAEKAGPYTFALLHCEAGDPSC